MSADKEDRATRYHNEGQKDGAKGNYSPPHNHLLSTFTNSKQENEDHAHYKEGYEHGKSQRTK